jgi:hypothetical protein
MQLKTISGPWQEQEIVNFLKGTEIPVRLAAIHPKGHPVIVSLWFLYEEGKIFCACRNSATIVSLINQNNNVGFEIAGEHQPYFGVRGHGVAVLNTTLGEPTLRKLSSRYLGDQETEFRSWLLDGAVNEVAIEITPTQVTSWDYRERMRQ